jgi:hypothetical protein
MNITDFLTLIQTPRKNKVTFANITYRSKGDNKLAKYVCLLGVSTENTYDSDIEELESAVKVMKGVELTAAEELLKSRKESKEKGVGNNSQYTLKDTLKSTNVEGIKVHEQTGEIYLTVQTLSQTVIEEGIPQKVVKSSEKTIAKNRIRKGLKSSRIRTFIIGKIKRAAFNGEVLEVEGEPMETVSV